MRFVVMAGDGIGEEITAATLAVLRAADKRFGLTLEYDAAEIGLKALKRHGTTHLPPQRRLFLDAVRSVARDFPEVETEEVIVDAMAALLVREPERFDVICATNFHADILSDLASELSGSLGLAGSVNAGDRLCCAQAQHGSAPSIAGQDRANPSSLILSAAMLLDWIAAQRGLPAYAEAARAIEGAVDAALAKPESRTADLGGTLGTRAFAERIAAAVAA